MAAGGLGYNHQHQHYKNVVGTVCELLNRYKAVLEFIERGVKQRALLKVEKISSKPELNPDGSEYPINFFVSIGTIIKCLCHKFDETGEHKCGWYVAEVLAVGLNLIDPKLLNGLCEPMLNRVGLISQVDKRQAIITYTDEFDNQHDVLLLGSKMFISGKRINSKTHLSSIVTINDKVYFDAVPVDAEENDKRFSWFATIGWKNVKPSVDYETAVSEADQLLSTIKTIIKNPKSQFIRGKGQVVRILNHEYGVALGLVNDKGNHWQSILFHRSNVSVFKFFLTDTNLCTVLQKGDKIRFIAAAAPSGYSTQWVASYIGIDVVGAAKDFVNGTIYANKVETGSVDGNLKPFKEKSERPLENLTGRLDVIKISTLTQKKAVPTPKTKGNKKKSLKHI